MLEGILCLDIFGRRTLKIRTPVRPYDDFSEMKFYRPRRGKDLISIRSSHSGEFIIIPPVENVSFVLQVKYFNEHTLIVANDKYFNNFGPVPVTRFDPSIHQVLVYRPSKYIFCFDTLVIKRVEKYLIKNKSTKRRKILYPPRRTELRPGKIDISDIFRQRATGFFVSTGRNMEDLIVQMSLVRDSI